MKIITINLNEWKRKTFIFGIESTLYFNLLYNSHVNLQSVVGREVFIILLKALFGLFMRIYFIFFCNWGRRDLEEEYQENLWVKFSLHVSTKLPNSEASALKK